jgi:hypothetical protein
MANITPAYAQVHPNYTAPEFIVSIQQASGYMEALTGGDPMVRLSEGDQYVYMKTLDVRTKVNAGQSAYNQLPSVTLNAAQISTPTYLVRVRAEYDHHDIAAGDAWGLSVPNAQQLGMRQGIFQQFRNAGLYGFNPLSGEGLLNTAGATAINLPPDTFGNDTILTYDNGQFAQFIQQQIANIKVRTMQMGMPAKVTILGPQRTLAPMEYNIVQLVQFQRQGAGTASTRMTIEDVIAGNGDVLEWTYDDTLIGKGANGWDMIVINLPTISRPGGHTIDTNEFAKVTPNFEGTAVQLCDMVAPREIPTPIPGGAIDVVSELRMTSGWGVRPEALTLLSAQYQ